MSRSLAGQKDGWLGRATYGIRILGINMTEASSEDHMVAFWTEGDRHASPEEDEGENVAVLGKDIGQSLRPLPSSD